MLWVRDEERKNKIEYLAANIYVRVISNSSKKDSYWFDLTDPSVARDAFALAETFIEEAERRGKNR